jgi:hypothetical protein
MLFRRNVACVLGLLISVQLASARNVGQWANVDPAQAEFYEKLKQPDQPSISCCGSGDAYFADKVDIDEVGNLVAIITDTRPDGPLMRVHVPVGTRIVIPKRKLRKHPIPNPTGHTVVFLASSAMYDDTGTEPPGSPIYSVYCYEPDAKG